jgi:putative ABC transport system permease protein
MPGILSYHLDSSVSEIRNTVRIANFWEQPVLKAGDTDPLKSKILFVDDDFFEIFTYQAIVGNLKKALNDPKSIVLSKIMAKRLFGHFDIVGEIIMLNHEHLLQVAAVIEVPEKNTFLDFEALISIEGRKIIQPGEEEYSNWDWWNFNTLIRSDGAHDPLILEEKIRSVFIDHSGREGTYEGIHLIPVSEIYFSDIEGGWLDHIRIGNFQQVLVLSMVAFLILLIAIINFINISSSQYFDRLKQAGIQKILGASKYHIIWQVLYESGMLFMISAWIGIILAEIGQGYLSQYLGIYFISGIIDNPLILLLILGFSTFLGIISGLPPAILMSRSKSIDNLKKSVSVGTGKSIVRSILVITQFSIAIVLIGFTLLVQKQIRFGMTNLDYGKDNVLGIRFTQQLFGKQDILEDELSKFSFVKRVSMTQFFPGKDISHWGLQIENKGVTEHVNFDIFDADPGIFEILDIKPVAGRLYTDELATDKDKAVVNQSFLKANEIQDPLGSVFPGFNGREIEIIGVIEDFHYEAVSKPIGPLLIRNSGNASVGLVQISGTDFNSLKAGIKEISKVCHTLSPDFPVEIHFMDQAVENMYRSEIRFRRIFTLFSSSAIFISCLGILALSIFVCNIKTKEIGIRKTFGASVKSIFNMLNREFARSVVVAFLIACPVSWYLMQQWLKGFSYKTELSWWIFAITLGMTYLVAMIAILFQSNQAATANPVDTFRTE